MNGERQTSKWVREWILRVFLWDGVLPIVSWLVPAVLQVFAHAQPWVIVVALIFLPAISALIRRDAGHRAIRENRCGPLVKGLQGSLLNLVVAAFLVCDIGLTFCHFDRQFLWLDLFQILIANPMTVLIVVLSYFSTMAFVMYPGPRLVEVDEFEQYRSPDGM